MYGLWDQTYRRIFRDVLKGSRPFCEHVLVDPPTRSRPMINTAHMYRDGGAVWEMAGWIACLKWEASAVLKFAQRLENREAEAAAHCRGGCVRHCAGLRRSAHLGERCWGRGRGRGRGLRSNFSFRVLVPEDLDLISAMLAVRRTGIGPSSVPRSGAATGAESAAR